MNDKSKLDWRKKVVHPEAVMKRIEPGMHIFIGTGVAEPRTLVKHLMASDAYNLQDLELIQIVSLGDAISLKELSSQKYRLKTFFSGWVASDAISTGRVDLIPSSFSRIPNLIASRRIHIDVAFLQITPPNEAGYCSSGVSADVIHEAMEQADLIVGEINPYVPKTFGDTFVPLSAFDMVIESTEKPLYFQRWPVDDTFDKVAANLASVIEDGSCIAYSIGPLYEALSPYLMHKHNLGIHSPFITDALMDLINSGAVTNRNKEVWRGKSLTCYAFGTEKLMAWLNRNPLIEFQGLDKAFSPVNIGRNPQFMAFFPARKVDLTGRIALHIGKGNVLAGPGEVMDFFSGARISKGGMVIFALPSRNLKKEPNILPSVEQFQNQITLRESIDMIVTEYGVAAIAGRTIRERAQAIIDIAHPEDREMLIQMAKEEKMLYQDQLFIPESAALYPQDVTIRHTFKDGQVVRFRAIKPSDEEEMRRLFYHLSERSVYYRYFTGLKTMPHSKMQEYVNVDYRTTMSVVGLVGEAGHGRIIAEARFVKLPKRCIADVAFIVDEKYQGVGIASFLFKYLIELAKNRGITGFVADVLSSNAAMMKVFEKGGLPLKTKYEDGAYEVSIPFEK